MKLSMTIKPSRKQQFLGRDSYMKYKVAYLIKDEVYCVICNNQVFQDDLSEDSAERLCQFLNNQSYLSTDPKIRASKPTPALEFNFEAIYNGYPRHEGKKHGIEKLKKTIKTVEQYNLLQQAVENYCRSVVEQELKFIKLFSTWTNCWTDYIPEHAINSDENGQLTLDEITGLMEN